MAAFQSRRRPVCDDAAEIRLPSDQDRGHAIACEPRRMVADVGLADRRSRMSAEQAVDDRCRVECPRDRTRRRSHPHSPRTNQKPWHRSRRAACRQTRRPMLNSHRGERESRCRSFPAWPPRANQARRPTRLEAESIGPVGWWRFSLQCSSADIRGTTPLPLYAVEASIGNGPLPSPGKKDGQMGGKKGRQSPIFTADNGLGGIVCTPRSARVGPRALVYQHATASAGWRRQPRWHIQPAGHVLVLQAAKYLTSTLPSDFPTRTTCPAR